jgi:hypothetical protein
VREDEQSVLLRTAFQVPVLGISGSLMEREQKLRTTDEAPAASIQALIFEFLERPVGRNPAAQDQGQKLDWKSFKWHWWKPDQSSVLLVLVSLPVVYCQRSPSRHGED